MHRYEFVPFLLDPAERRLLRNGEPVPLTPKCFDLLVVLVENSGHLLEKSDLLARLWPDQFIEEGSLSFNVSELRRALGEGLDGQSYIETVRKKGFRFVAPVKRISVAADGTADAAVADSEGGAVVVSGPIDPPPGATQQVKIVAGIAVVTLALLGYLMWSRGRITPIEGRPRTIAVLPFKPLVANMRDEPLEMGICDALITRLAALDQLVVRPTSSVVPYNRMGQDPLAAGRELRVDALLEGYVQRSHDRIRVTARLLRTADGKSLWSGQFNERFTDIFAVEDSISRQIAEALHLNLTGDQRRRVTKHPTDNAEAYELYLKGRYFQDKRTVGGLRKSIEYFREATVKDPRYARAFAALANSYGGLAVRADMPPKDSYRNARAAAMRAMEIDGTTAEAHSAMANVNFWYDWDWTGAEREFKRAIELSANDPITFQQYAGYLMAMGRQREALSNLQRAQRLDPLSLQNRVQTARVYYFSRQYDAAVEQCLEAIHMDEDFGPAHLFLGRTYTRKGLYPQALAELARARELIPDSAEVLSLSGCAYAASGGTTEARQMLEGLRQLSKQRYVSPYHLAMIHACLGANDAALKGLQEAYDDREGRMSILRLVPEFDALHGDPGFTELLGRMKLPQSNH